MDQLKMQWKAPKLLSILFAAVLLLACTSFPSENVDPNKNNKDVFRKELAECKQDYPESGSGVHFRQWTNCMNLKGWK